MVTEAGVTGTMLRDMVVCERRAWHDAHAEDRDRDEVGAFVRILWSEGVRHEAEVLDGLGGRVADLRRLGPTDRSAATLAALHDPDVDQVLGAEIAIGDLLGRPDVVSRIDGRWVSGDVKSGAPFMPDGVRIREEYGVQVGLYAVILERAGLGDGGRAFVIGPDGRRTVFDLHAPWGDATMAGRVLGLIDDARSILSGAALTRGAASAACGLCHWRTLCRGELEGADDLTLVAEVGRAMRGVLEAVAPTRAALAELDVDAVRRPDGRPGLPGLGAARLLRFRDRARLQVSPGSQAYARRLIDIPHAGLEWHLDIESDPTRGGLVYLHGVWERRREASGTRAERFVHFFADGGDAAGERRAFADAWAFLTSDPAALVLYYSPFERVAYRALQARHPEVCSAADVEKFFSAERVIDLYTGWVRPHTEWPLHSYGIKPIAKSRGFAWRAEDASGASSIAWYDEYRRTGDAAVRDRIVDYNRSDCMASAVVLDALRGLPVGAPPWPPGPSNGVRTVCSDADPHAGVTSRGSNASDEEARWRAEGRELADFFSALDAGTGSEPPSPMPPGRRTGPA